MVKRSLLLKMLLCKRSKQKKSGGHRHQVDSFQGPSVSILDFNLKNEYEDSLGNYKTESCRVCLKDGTIPIFGDDTNEDLAGALSIYANIIIRNDDFYPKHLCYECHSLLQSAILLRKTAEQTDSILRNPKQEVPEEEEIFDDATPSENSYEKTKEKTEILYCTFCNLNFNSSKELLMHRRTLEHMEQKEGRQKCTICNKEYSALYLRTHMAIHEGRLPYMCDICGKAFSTKGKLVCHRDTHSFNLRFHCHLCPYRGRYANSLKLHMRTHTGDKPYHCPECPMRCISKSNLNKHMSIHKKEHNFSCDSCGKGFYGKKDLESHIRVDHGGLKEHVCNICGKAFGYRKQMMKHQRKVHKREKLRGGRMPTYLLADRKKELGESD